VGVMVGRALTLVVVHRTKRSTVEDPST